MRVHAISDIHVDYPQNMAWLRGISEQDFKADALIVAGDLSDDLELLARALGLLRDKFASVHFIAGNHDLWVRGTSFACSLEKLAAIEELCDQLRVHTRLHQAGDISFLPLYGWYDYSFAAPDRHLRRAWRDYRACAWPQDLASSAAINRYFLDRNRPHLSHANAVVISFSHFLPRIDLMPESIPPGKRRVYPVLGSEGLGIQVQTLRPAIHVYGHSHVNQDRTLLGTRYINNAFGYPAETRIARKSLRCIFDPNCPASPQNRSAGT